MCSIIKQKIILTNDNIVYGLKNNDRKILNQVYSKYYPIIQRHILINGGSEDDAKDIFQDAIVILYHKATTNTLILNGKFLTLLYSVCKHIWLRTIIHNDKHPIVPIDTITLPYIDDTLSKIEQDKIEEIKKVLFDEHFKKLSNRDQDIMKSSIGISTAELATKYNLTVDSAKTRKYACRQKLKSWIQNDEKYKHLTIDD
jgi:RNA polymerase sigma factor (sigma-70 family)